jgi:hypothetical protein
MVSMMWFILFDGVRNTLMIQYLYDGYSMLIAYA